MRTWGKLSRNVARIVLMSFTWRKESLYTRRNPATAVTGFSVAVAPGVRVRQETGVAGGSSHLRDRGLLDPLCAGAIKPLSR